MYISHKHKIIWWSLETSDGGKMSEILKKYGFLVENDDNSGQYDDYKVLCTISNPYYSVFDLFLGFVSPNKVIKKKFIPDLREKFNKFVESSFKSYKLDVKTVNFSENDEKYFKKLVFSGKIPDYFVRLEYFYEDLGKIDFIDLNDVDKGVIYEDLYDYKKMYDFNNAKKVYHHLKKHFYLCDYDPFSFTHKELTKEEKISFLHGLL